MPRVVRRHPLRLALAVVLLVGLLGAPHASSMLQRLVASGFTSKMTYAETSGGTEQGDLLLGVTGKGTFSGSVRGVAVAAVYVAGKVTGVPYKALAKGGKYVARYDIDAKNDYKGIVVATFSSPGIGSLCFTASLDHGVFKPGSRFIPATGTVAITGGTGQAAKLRGGATYTQTDVNGSPTETLLGKGLLNMKMSTPRPMSAACKAVQKIG